MSIEIYQQLIKNGEIGIITLIDDKVQEGLSLEFKVKENSEKSALEPNDRSALGKTLSAFANSAGGLMVWGVEARKDRDGLDCATGRKPIKEIQVFSNAVVRACAELLQPRHDGIEVHLVPATDPGSGYLLIWVPRSGRRPHQCEAKGKKGYYKRAGESSFLMEHYDIEDAFRRKTLPELEVHRKIKHNGTKGILIKFLAIISLRNVSEVSSTFPFLSVSLSPGLDLPHNPPVGIKCRSDSLEHIFYTAVDVIIHPGESTVLAHVSWEVDTHNLELKNLRSEGKKLCLDLPNIPVRFGCTDVRAKRSTLKISPEEFIEILEPIIKARDERRIS